jgi:flavin-dependent dehydrogenase
MVVVKNEYDVVILGGGLAGLTLSIQLKKEENANYLTAIKAIEDFL